MIETLISRMTLSEKLGQLTMSACSSAVTGPVIAGDSTDAIKNGEIGNLLNLLGAANVNEMQRLAQESRLRIPLLIGFDVIHGHRTLFPIPLGEAALFDPLAWTSSARESAMEAAADGVAMTFAPMLDIARDPRWGAAPRVQARTLGWRRASPKPRYGAIRVQVWSRPIRLQRRPSTSAPMARWRRGVTMHRWTSPSEHCMKCICRHS